MRITISQLLVFLLMRSLGAQSARVEARWAPPVEAKDGGAVVPDGETAVVPDVQVPDVMSYSLHCDVIFVTL